MAIAFVQAPSVNHSSSGASDNSLDSLNFSALPTVGNTVVGFCVGKSSNSSYMTISDSYGNTYTHQRVGFTVVSTDYYATIAYTTVSSIPGSGFHITASFDGSGTGLIGIYVAEFSGVGYTDGTMISSAYNADTHPAPSDLTVTSGNLGVVLFQSNDTSSSETITTPSGWTLIDRITGLAGIISGCAYGIGMSSPSNPSWTIGTTCNWVCTQRAFEPASAPAGLGIDALLMFHL